MIRLVPDRFDIAECGGCICWPKFRNGYADAMITASGLICMALVHGDYPASIAPDFFIGKQADDVLDIVEGAQQIKEAVATTIQTGRGIAVRCSINGHRRIGMTIFVNHYFAILRLFAQR